MNRRSRTIGAVVLICCIAVIAGVLCFFLTFNKQYFDWNLEGVWITADGQIEGAKLISVSGYVVDRDDLYDNVHLEYHFPGGGEYLDARSDTGNFSHTQWNDHFGYFGCLSMSIDAEDGKWVECHYALDLDKGYILFQWDDGEERYFVASADEKTKASDIVTHFKAFIDTNSFD